MPLPLNHGAMARPLPDIADWAAIQRGWFFYFFAAVRWNFLLLVKQ